MPSDSIFFRRLKYFDAYPKTLEDFRVKTFTGAIITITCVLLTIILFSYEWLNYLGPNVQQEIFVDVTRNEKMNINIDIKFPSIPCILISVDAMDVSGESQTRIGLEKRILNSLGEERSIAVEKREKETTKEPTSNAAAAIVVVCGSCYGAETPHRTCCTTCDDVRMAYIEKRWHFSPFVVEQCKNELDVSQANRVGEGELESLLRSGDGCRLLGHLEVNKVAGSFHIAPGYSYEENHMHVHDVKITQVNLFNSSHIVKSFHFGNQRFPNQQNPLENTTQIETEKASVSYNYYIKIVPTTYEYVDGTLLNNSYQYSVTKSQKIVDAAKDPGKSLPGLFFTYELSPIMVKFIEQKKSFTHFLTSCCAIIGGIFTVAGLIDSFVYKYYTLYKKMQINKLT
jgi:hypothetical protein